MMNLYRDNEDEYYRGSLKDRFKELVGNVFYDAMRMANGLTLKRKIKNLKANDVKNIKKVVETIEKYDFTDSQFGAYMNTEMYEKLIEVTKDNPELKKEYEFTNEYYDIHKKNEELDKKREKIVLPYEDDTEKYWNDRDYQV